jgi:hypothetical protein
VFLLHDVYEEEVFLSWLAPYNE